MRLANPRSTEGCCRQAADGPPTRAAAASRSLTGAAARPTSGFPGQSRRNRRVSHFRADRFEQRFDPALTNSTRDEDDAAAAIIPPPPLEPPGPATNLLHPVDHPRPPP